jgi:hypothetical protein
MAKSENTGTVVQAWVSPKFAREIKELADRDGRTVSNLIRVALRDRLSSATSPTTGEGPAPLGGEPVSSRHGDAAPTST